MSVPESPQPPAADSVDCGEDRADGGVVESGSEQPSSAETCASSFPGWIKSPDRGPTGPAGLNFSPVNSNLRDLTPSHTLEPLVAPFRPDALAGAAAGSTAGTGSLVVSQAPFSEGQAPLFYPCSEEGGSLGFSRSLNGDGSGDGGGSAQNPPQKKKVSEHCHLYVTNLVFSWLLPLNLRLDLSRLSRFTVLESCIDSRCTESVHTLPSAGST